MYKILKTSVKEYGPFRSIIREANGWLCDGDTGFDDNAIGEAQVIDTDRAPYNPTAMRELRAERNARLDASDKYVLGDRWDAYSVEQRNAWATYRQALRDLPATTLDAENPIWPTFPVS